MSHPLSIVVAVAENGVIGRGNALPWRLRTDLQRFRRLTLGKPMIMGLQPMDRIARLLGVQSQFGYGGEPSGALGSPKPVMYKFGKPIF